MNKKNVDVLEKCIDSMESGISVEECIKKNPDLTPEIREILMTTKFVMNLRAEQIPIEKMNLNRAQLLSRAKLLLSSDEKGKPGWGFNRSFLTLRRKLFSLFSLRPIVWRFVLVVAITGLFITFSRGLVITSAKSLPGDSLYPIKIVVEDISVFLVRNREVRQEYESNYSQQRVDEIKRLITLKRIQRISFEGTIESIDAMNWMVSGITVILQPDTILVSGINKAESFKVGSVIEVEGITNLEEAVTGNEIHLREYQYYGIVETINPSVWQISGVQLLITSKTQIDEGIRVGDNVNVLIRSEDNGLYALAILHEEQPDANPIIQKSALVIPMQPEVVTAGIEEQQWIIGTLEKASDNNWEFNGKYEYIDAQPDISADIKEGDSISVNYRTEAKGSFTTSDSERTNKENQLHNNEPQEKPEIGLERKCGETSFADISSNGEYYEGKSLLENGVKSEATGEHGDSQ